MPEFIKQKKSNVNWYSESFYSHNKGYKLSLRVNTAGYGNGKGTDLSVFLNLMKGPHDDELTWPLSGEYEIELLNQIGDYEHHSLTMSFNTSSNHVVARVIEEERTKGSQGYSMFISHKDLHKTTPTCQYLKDDCLFFQVSKL